MKKIQLEKINLDCDMEVCGNFLQFISEATDNQQDILNIIIQDNQLQNYDLSKLTFENIIFRDCSFTDVVLEHCSFNNVLFDSCSFSNCNFSKSWFEKCEFRNSQYKSSNFSSTNIINVSIQGSGFRYANFTSSRF
ncbi:MAG: pentapeptide repeat-containing protein, partial [Oscillospiraceae bacterium]